MVFTPLWGEIDFVNLKRTDMKKIMITLAVLGLTWGAQAQTKCVCPAKAKAHKVAHVTRQRTNTLVTTRTYQVCREQGGYDVCCLHKETVRRPMGDRPLANNDIPGLKKD